MRRSGCETQGIAGLEAAVWGVRPVVPYEGGTAQYYGWNAEYHDPLSVQSMAAALRKAWKRGRLLPDASNRYAKLTWRTCTEMTLAVYQQREK